MSLLRSVCFRCAASNCCPGLVSSPHLTPTKEKETHRLRRTVSPLHHEATKQKLQMGIWRVNTRDKEPGQVGRLSVWNASIVKGWAAYRRARRTPGWMADTSPDPH
eukprot:728872-Pelagomonas_calceolata.AAC.2